MSLHWGGAAAASLYSGYGGAMGPGGYGGESLRLRTTISKSCNPP